MLKVFGEEEVIQSEEYRNVIGNLASGVSVITTEVDGVKYGLTASAVTSLSLEPPMILVCINQNTGTCHAVSESDYFSINILNIEQGELARKFATPNSDKFGGVKISTGKYKQPLLEDALVNLECKVIKEMTGGTHRVFMAEVLHAKVHAEKEPLVYYCGKFGEFNLTI